LLPAVFLASEERLLPIDIAPDSRACCQMKCAANAPLPGRRSAPRAVRDKVGRLKNSQAAGSKMVCPFTATVTAAAIGATPAHKGSTP
jgi:hypothetical protein